MLEIEDPDREVRPLLALLDGSRTVAEVDRAFHEQLPDSGFDVPEAITQLDEAGLLEDAAATTTLTRYDLERFKRNIGFFETYADLSTAKYAAQEQIRDCRVLLLGLGGVGSYVSLSLLGAGVQDLRVLDFDKVELSNLNRQILYSEAVIGERKVEAALGRLQEYYPGARIEGVERKLSAPADLDDIVADRDFVFCAVDRPKMHVIRWVNDACVRAGVPFIGGGVELQRSIIYLIQPGVTGCLECWRLSNADDETTRSLRAQMEERHEGNTGVGPDLAAFGPLVSVLNSLMVTEFVRHVTRIVEPIAAGRLMETRFEDMSTHQAEQWERRPDCPVCGDRAALVSAP
ncbi:ThiF family adenylyltransferase [Actinosynnema sp. NPDC020468]|uniref:HesA/MoeB/ThiF family protein n=1 Tax=Actinosynnema sp. NPDC020468 TaxID=3154488 RepID=UPI0033FB3494